MLLAAREATGARHGDRCNGPFPGQARFSLSVAAPRTPAPPGALGANWEDTMHSDDTPGAGHGRLLATLERLLTIQALEVKGALDEASTLVAEAMGADKVDAFLHDPSTETLVSVGTSDTPLGHKERRLGLDRLPLANGGRVVAVFHSGASFQTGHTEDDPEDIIGIKRGLGVRSTLAAAIEIAGERRGVLAITSTQPERFSFEDLRFTEAVARWMGLIAHRAALVEQVTQEASEQARRVAADELIAVLAHDLRTPLTPARGYLTLLRRDAQQAGRAQAVRYAEQVGVALDRVQRMIGALLDASRLEQGLFALALQPVDLVALVHEIADTLRTPARPLCVQAPDVLIVEQADPERLRQALENLVGNALGHTPEGVAVVVAVDQETREDRAWAVLRVRDAGPGIAPTLLPTLFERFARGSASTGLGLGLYLARGIAEAHGGPLTVESTVGTGTTFCLSLPPS